MVTSVMVKCLMSRLIINLKLFNTVLLLGITGSIRGTNTENLYQELGLESLWIIRLVVSERQTLMMKIRDVEILLLNENENYFGIFFSSVAINLMMLKTTPYLMQLFNTYRQKALFLFK